MYRQKFKVLETRVKAQEEENKDLREEIEKLKSQNTSKYEGINNKLSDFAQKAIETAKGPMKPDQLLTFLMNDVYGKRQIEALVPIRKYNKNIDGVRKQLSNIHETLQAHVKYRKKQKELDDKFIKILKKLDETIEQEKEKEMKSGAKLTMQTSLDQYFPGYKVSYKVTHEVNCSNDQNSLEEKVFQEPGTNKQELPEKEEKPIRKRKIRTDDESSSNQEDGDKHSASRSSKRLKLNASKNTTKSSDSCMSVDELDEPMSVEEGTQPMSISEGSSSAMSVDDSADDNQQAKTNKKETGKSSKQPVSKFRKDATNYSGKEETVPERQFNLRGNKPL